MNIEMLVDPQATPKLQSIIQKATGIDEQVLKKRVDCQLTNDSIILNNRWKIQLLTAPYKLTVTTKDMQKNRFEAARKEEFPLSGFKIDELEIIDSIKRKDQKLVLEATAIIQP